MLFDRDRMHNQHAHYSDRDLLLLLLHNQHIMETRIMGALEDALAAEDAVIAQVVALINGLPSTADLQAKLDAANAALADLQVQDNADKAALQDALDEIAAATQAVVTDTDTLKSLVPSDVPGV